MLKNIADQVEAAANAFEKLTVAQLKELPSNRFREDLIEQLIIAGVSQSDSEFIGCMAHIQLSYYEPENVDFQRIISGMVKTVVIAKDKIPKSIQTTDSNLWTRMVNLSIVL